MKTILVSLFILSCLSVKAQTAASEPSWLKVKDITRGGNDVVRVSPVQSNNGEFLVTGFLLSAQLDIEVTDGLGQVVYHKLENSSDPYIYLSIKVKLPAGVNDGPYAIKVKGEHYMFISRVLVIKAKA